MKTYMMRTCDRDLRSNGGTFQWPSSGEVVAPDWDAMPVCGKGLHGLLHGYGDGSLLSWDASALWVVCSIDPDTYVDLTGKIKVPRATVEYVGDRHGATEYLLAVDPEARRCTVVGGTATAGDHGTAAAGYRGTATAGHGGTAAAGDHGTATAGYGGTATAGYRGTATAGDGGTATAGYGGTAAAGCGGMVMSGTYGIISLNYHDSEAGRVRVAVAYVGEGGIKPNTKYRLNDARGFEEAK